MQVKESKNSLSLDASDVKCDMTLVACVFFDSINLRITTMGSGTSRGVAYIINLTALPEYYSSASLVLHQLASFESTIWTADCKCNGNKVVIGNFYIFSLIENNCTIFSFYNNEEYIGCTTNYVKSM